MSRPSARVTVSVTAADLDVTRVSPTVLVFTPNDWDTPKSVTVTAQQDGETPAEDEHTEIRLSASGSEYSGFTRRIAVTVNDDETEHLNLSAPVLSVSEGESTTFTVALTRQPSGDVSVTASTTQAAFTGLSAGGQEPAQNLTLTFTPGNWSTPQTVTVSTQSDTDSEDETANIELSGFGGRLPRQRG